MNLSEKSYCNIGILEDHSGLRASIEDFLHIKEQYRVVFSYGKLAEVLNRKPAERVQYLLLDEHLEDSSGINAIPALKRHLPGVQVILMTGDQEPNLIVNALKNGANGFLHKPFSLSKLENAFADIAMNGSYLQPATTTSLIKTLCEQRTANSEKFNLLSIKEKEIVTHLIEGKSYKEIAALLKKSFFVINYHIKNMYNKFNVNSKAELIYKLNSTK